MEKEMEQGGQIVSCRVCGKEIEKESTFCKFCGVHVKTGRAPVLAKKYPRTSAAAAVALILSVLGLVPVVGLIPVFFAIILAVAALKRLAARPEKLKGNHLAVAALVMSGFAGIFTTVFLLFGIIIPDMKEEKIRTSEQQAIATLQKIALAQKDFKTASIVDQDGDGTGEYGFLQELSGVLQPRGANFKVMRILDEKYGRASKDGVVTLAGYKYMMYLPGAGGQGALAELNPLPGPSRTNADLQEKKFICFAWPEKYNVTGRRRFLITEAGSIYFSDGFIEGNAYYKDNGTDIPPANAAMKAGLSRAEYSELCASLAGAYEVACDGMIWEPLK